MVVITDKADPERACIHAAFLAVCSDLVRLAAAKDFIVIANKFDSIVVANIMPSLLQMIFSNGFPAYAPTVVGQRMMNDDVCGFHF
jgi:hypothetical protein